MDAQEQVVFLHGIGVGSESWEAQLDALPDGFTGIAPQISGLTDKADGAFTMSSAAADVISVLDRQGIDQAHLCGLSLGAMIAVQVAIEYPKRVSSLILSGGHLHPPRILMVLQTMLTRVLPARVVAPDGTSKQRVREVLAEVARIDFRPHLAHIVTPTLILCGSKDIANLSAARALAAGIPDAKLHVIDGGGHELNTGKPDQFNAEAIAFLQQRT